MFLIRLPCKIIKICEKFPINYLGCDSFTDTSKPYEPPDSETRDSLARLLEFSCTVYQFPISTGHCKDGQV